MVVSIRRIIVGLIGLCNHCGWDVIDEQKKKFAGKTYCPKRDVAWRRE
jgi:hypothetical protein